MIPVTYNRQVEMANELLAVLSSVPMFVAGITQLTPDDFCAIARRAQRILVEREMRISAGLRRQTK